MCPGYTVTWTSAPVGISTQPAASYCLYCFSQVLKCLWSLHVSGISRHMDLYSDRNVHLISWFILSVLFLTGGEMSVVSTHVQYALFYGPPP